MLTAVFVAATLAVSPARADLADATRADEPPVATVPDERVDEDAADREGPALRRALVEYCATARHGKRAARGCRVLLHRPRTPGRVYVEQSSGVADIWAADSARSDYLWHVELRRVGAAWRVVSLQREEELGC